MARETEIKLRVQNAGLLRKKLKRLKARPVTAGSGRVHEMNVIFDTPQGGLAKHGQLLRIRTETPEGRTKKGRGSGLRRVLLTFKRPTMPLDAAPSMEGRAVAAGRHKVREEIEVEVTDAANLTKIFEGLGMRGWFRYEKYRTTFQLPPTARWAQGLLIELDETPIGTFVELEGPAEAIDRAAKELGFSPRDYVLKNYLALYAEECRRRNEEPRDMVFAKPK
ncbi:MAG TPA: class IV adenylate cyclase [Candidatus Acidoferrum sp.]|nr:class IV adenylate cyclase [Candidatus Acidoferrum sp.]